MRTFMPLRVSMICVLFSGAALVSGQPFYSPPEVVLRAKVRDFKEKNPTDTLDFHPHFNDQNACNASALGINTVQADLDVADPDDGGGFPGDNRTPALADSLGAMARCYNPPERFSDWFADRGPAVNRAFLVDLRFKLDTATGVYQFKDNAFFPIDSGKTYSKFDPADPDPFGHLQTDTVDGLILARHNFGFTMELHTEFRYDEGEGQVLTFQGDDDIWVFMNGKRVLDFGGVHPALSGEADLDSLKSILGLEDGMTYPLDFFFAERHTASSSCLITTNMDLSTSIPVVAAPVASPENGLNTDYPLQVSLGTPTPDAVIFFTLDGTDPDSSHTRYEEPFAVSHGTVVKAIAYRLDWIASPILVETYSAGTAIGRPGPSFASGFRGPSEVAIFDRSGRMIRRLEGGEARAWGGSGARGWDRLDSHGRTAAPGVYFWRIPAEKTTTPASGLFVLP